MSDMESKKMSRIKTNATIYQTKSYLIYYMKYNTKCK